DTEVDRRGRVDAVGGANLAQDTEGAGSRVSEITRLGQSVRVVELRQDQRVNPFRVGRALDALRKLGPHVLDQRVAHAWELPQMAVVRKDDAGTRKVERVQVRV